MEPTFDQVIEYMKFRRQMHCHDAEKRFDGHDKALDKMRGLAVQQCIDGLKAMRKRIMKSKGA